MTRARLGIVLAVAGALLVIGLVWFLVSALQGASRSGGSTPGQGEGAGAAEPEARRLALEVGSDVRQEGSPREEEPRAETAQDAVAWLMATEHLFALDCSPEDGLSGAWDPLSQVAPAEESASAVRIYRTAPSGRQVIAAPPGPVVLTWADGRCDAIPVESSIVRGRIEGPEGQPAARARVQVCRARTWTADDGTFEVEVQPDRTAMVQGDGALWCTAQAEHPELGRSSPAADPVVLGDAALVELVLDGEPARAGDLYDQADVVAGAALAADLDSQTREDLAVIGQWMDGAPEGVQPGLEALARSREARDGSGEFWEDQALDLIEERAETLEGG